MNLEPYDEQTPFLGRKRRYYGFISGIGAGKTFVGGLRALLNAQEWNPGELGAIIAPTGTNIRDVIVPELRQMGLFDVDGVEYRGKSAEEPGIHFTNGSRIILEGADNRRKIERLRGLNLAWFWMDEAAIIPEAAWDILTGRLRQGEYRNGFVTTTPKGANWVHDRFVDAVDGEHIAHGDATVYADAETLSLLEVPTHANPHNPEDYRQSVESEYDGAFYRQEVLGEFTKFDGLVYPWFREDDHVVADAPAGPYDRVIYGVDWGFSNPSVALAIGIKGDQYVVLDEFAEPRITDDDLADVVAGMYDEYGPGTVFCDPAEPGSIETFKRAGLDATGAENPITPGIKYVTSMQDQLLVHDSCQTLINEFGMYQYRDDDARDEPIDANNHALDALRYALYTHDAGQVGTGTLDLDDPDPDAEDAERFADSPLGQAISEYANRGSRF